ncbi:UDP-glucuronosyltransferase 3A2 [Microcaecilia unicolor]|uniref:UDP-glucuronosyltransferase n=1 Tax=Microcaecilia unicolor TaxID=1415580 RepID=A0A6P7X6H6_9AMPH|nr:UDP-glucuronosyltransferase 3A2 [Microcaecilia unicolor]
MRRAEPVLLVFLQLFVLPEAARILSLSFVGGSHYLIFNEISRVLHERGHEVRLLMPKDSTLITGADDSKESKDYQVTMWSAGDEIMKKYKAWFLELQKEFLKGRFTTDDYMEFMRHLAVQCDSILSQSDILNSLRNEKFDIAVIDAFNPCTFLVVEKLELPFIAFFHGPIVNAIQIGIPSPPSYVPVPHTHLSDRMDFWGRVKNCFNYFMSQIINLQAEAQFNSVIQAHFQAGLRPSLPDLYNKAELWIYVTDFSIEFSRPLLPNTICIGSLLVRPAQPVSQELEDFIRQSGEAGFIILTMGSMLSSLVQLDIVKEMNAGFAHLPQKVIWRYQPSQWPQELKLAPNVKIVEWLPQNDLLGHPKARLLVTHGGLNSLMEAIYHGVPVLGIPLFADQSDNMIRIEAKQIGISLPPYQLTADRFAKAMRQILEDARYKTAAKALQKIRQSYPFAPEEQLIRWVEHIILSGGGAHLRPYGSQQPWYQQYLLDVALFLTASFILVVYCCVKLVKIILKVIYPGKLKQT